MFWIVTGAVLIGLLWMVHDSDPVDFRGREIRDAVARRDAQRALAARRVRRARYHLRVAGQLQAVGIAVAHGRRRAGTRNGHGLAGAH
ncbi:hypothetical protein P0W64_07555 [Tsukamurella sp. 8F]|uniref:hypothetical protein n=1 Tax=unclassified Tsukamurella TaxID=2633480 RepID=UPI0023B8A8B2|nr:MULTISPECIES: hypothetical protein [unclassified Tsukamurella]MDF0528791.1 hypothetical protein [Tsukamurella sp. 8J]MDF0586626.1 hypothetical protein [Tsukamurella sp. 8F]